MVEAAKVLGWEYDADLKTAREPNGEVIVLRSLLYDIV